MFKTCKVHNRKYDYICPECVQFFLKNTNFSNLEEIRKYQKENANKIKVIDTPITFNLIGVIKTNIVGEFDYSSLIIYNTKKNQFDFEIFKRFKPLFTEYFPSILFLTHTEIYLDLIKDLELSPDCYIVNSAGQAHPYLYGAACDFGLKIDVPVIGFTKTLLFGNVKSVKNAEIRGIYHSDRLIGYAIPKANSKKYVYISVGNNISLDNALKVFTSIDYSVFSVLNAKLSDYIKKENKYNK